MIDMNTSNLSPSSIPCLQISFIWSFLQTGPTLKVVPVSTISDLAASQVTGVSTIQAFVGLVWYNARSDWGFSTDFRVSADILSGLHPTGISNATEVLDSDIVKFSLRKKVRVFIKHLIDSYIHMIQIQ